MKFNDVKVLACLASDIDASYIWSNCISLGQANRFFRVRVDDGEWIVVRILYASENFKRRYSKDGHGRAPIIKDDQFIVLSEHYRSRLGIEGTSFKTGRRYKLELKQCRWFEFGGWRAASVSPNPFLRQSVFLAWVSLGLGIVSLLLALVSLLLALVSLLLALWPWIIRLVGYSR